MARGSRRTPKCWMPNPCGPPQKRGSFTRPQNASGRGFASGSSPTRSDRLLGPFKARIRLFSPTPRFFPGVFLSPSAEKAMAGLIFIGQRHPRLSRRKKSLPGRSALTGVDIFLPDSKKARKSSDLLAFPTFPCSIQLAGVGLEPTDIGFRIRCLNQLGDTPVFFQHRSLALPTLPNRRSLRNTQLKLVRSMRVELIWISPPPPQSGASTNFATTALDC